MKRYTRIRIRDAYANKHMPEYMRALADFFWRIFLSVAFVILFLSLGYGILELSSAIGESAVAQSTDTVQPLPKLDKAQLQNTLDAFGERETRFNASKTAAQKISDPSR